MTKENPTVRISLSIVIISWYEIK
ncbi:unnamed protein product, partial [Didymodactylos carnosus]